MWPEDGFGGARESVLARSGRAVVPEGAERRGSGGPPSPLGLSGGSRVGTGPGRPGPRGSTWPVRTAVQGSLGLRHLDERAALQGLAQHPKLIARIAEGGREGWVGDQTRGAPGCLTGSRWSSKQVNG